MQRSMDTRAHCVPSTTLSPTSALVSLLLISLNFQSSDHVVVGSDSLRARVLPFIAADYLDLYLIHSPLSGKEKRLETWRALVECKKAGKLRTIGVSN